MPKKQSTRDPFQFEGFLTPNYTQVPDQLFDELLPLLSGAELKVLLYIIRRTFGFKKDHDEISLNQICSGIQTRDGRVLDSGTGLSQSTVLVAVKGLLEKRIILAQRRMSQEKGNEPTLYHLNLQAGFPENRGRGGTKIGEGLPRKSGTQETVLQETGIQQTVDSKVFEGHSLDIRPADFHFSRKRDFENKNDDKGSRTQSDRIAPHRGGGFTAVADVVRTRRKKTSQSGSGGPDAAATPTTGSRASSPKASPSGRPRAGGRRSLADQATPDITVVMGQVSSELYDDAERSSLGRAVRLWQKSKASEGNFIAAIYAARKIAKQQGHIEKRATGEAGEYGFRNRMPYFLTVLADQLGLRDNVPDTS